MMFFSRYRNICYCLQPKRDFRSNLSFDRKTSSNFLGNEVPKPELDIEYLCNPKNTEEIEINIRKRKGIGNIHRVQDLYGQLINAKSVEKKNIEDEFLKEAIQIPNKSYQQLLCYNDNPKILNTINQKKEFTFMPKEFNSLTKYLKVFRSENLGNFSGHKSYYLLGDLAEIEQALIKLALNTLFKKGFKLVTVPDILPRHIVENCGMKTSGERTQVYELDAKKHIPDMILSGTSEMALGGYFMNKTFLSTELPIKHVAVSRCYRAETSRVSDERGIYRVHQFTKVEMFAVTDQGKSNETLEEFRKIQEEFFSSFGFHLQTLDMPLHELGAPAFRKYDIEAWFPGRKIFGEVSSCSNCTDYQSRRLNIKYKMPNDDKLLHAHTINGTACAIPRMLIALLETHQQSNGSVAVPEILQPYMDGKHVITRNEFVPKFNLLRKNINKFHCQ